MSTEHPVRQFQAFGPCPQCGDRDLHDFTTPPNNDPDMKDGEDHREEEDKTEIHSWGGGGFVSAQRHTTHYYRADKTTCDVIRTCNHCHQRWPEK